MSAVTQRRTGTATRLQRRRCLRLLCGSPAADPATTMRATLPGVPARSAYPADALIGRHLHCQAAAAVHCHHSAGSALPPVLARAHRQTRAVAGQHTCSARSQQRQALAGQGRARARVQHLRAEQGCSPAEPPFQPKPAHARCGACQARSAAPPHASSGAGTAQPVPHAPHTADAHAAQSACLRRAARHTAVCSGAPAPSEQARLRDRVARGAAARACARGRSGRACFIFSVRWSSTWQVMPSHARSAGYCTARPSPPESTGALLMHTQRSPVPSCPGAAG